MREKEKIVTVCDKNRVTIPISAFKALNISTGDQLLVKWSENKIEIIPIEVKERAT